MFGTHRRSCADTFRPTAAWHREARRAFPNLLVEGEEIAMGSTVKFVLALPFLTIAVLLSIPCCLCMYTAAFIQGEH